MVELIELNYRPTVGDYASALRARMRVSRASRRQRWVLGLLVVLVPLQAVVGLAFHDVQVFPLVLMASVALLIQFTPWLQARTVYRFAERQGVFHVTVTDAGVSVASDNTTASVNWVAQSRYRETADVFVMFSPDKNAVGFTVLPKRGVQHPADVDGLRALLDRHLTRV